MMHQSKILLAAGLIAVSSTACFTDPTESLRGGPDRLELEQSALTLTGGDSGVVQVLVRDKQGNQLPVTNLSLTTADAAIATARAVSLIAPGDLFARGIINAAANAVGPTTVTVTANGLTATMRVLVLPAKVPGAVSVTGTAYGDTIVINRPAPLTPLVIPYSAGDTLVLNSTATVTFSATTSAVTFGANPGMIIARSATQIKALARQGYAGRVTVTNLTYAGTAETGPVALASLQTDSILIGHARFRPATAPVVSADPNFGANTYLTVTAADGMTFDATSGAGIGGTPAAGTSANVVPTPLIVLSRTATTLGGIVGGNVTGTVVVTGVLLGTARVDSVRTQAAVTVSKSSFPGTVTNGAGNMLDTIVIKGNGLATFTLPTASATSPRSVVTINGDSAWVIVRTADSIRAIARRQGTGAVSISNVIIQGTTIPTLASSGATAVSTTVTGEPNEPANDAPNVVAIPVAGSTATNPVVVFGAVDGNGVGVGTDADDFFTFTLATAGPVNMRLEFIGTGAGGATNPDIDLLFCSSGCASFPEGFAGATAGNPETHNIANLAAGTYNVYINGWDTGSVTFVYKLRINQ